MEARNALKDSFIGFGLDRTPADQPQLTPADDVTNELITHCRNITLDCKKLALGFRTCLLYLEMRILISKLNLRSSGILILDCRVTVQVVFS